MCPARLTVMILLLLIASVSARIYELATKTAPDCHTDDFKETIDLYKAFLHERGEEHLTLSNSTISRILPDTLSRTRVDAMWIATLLLLMLFFEKSHQAPGGKSSSVNAGSDENYRPPVKRMKSSCYFADPRTSPLEKYERDSHHKVSSTCEGTMHSMAELAESYDRKMFGAPHELALCLCRAEGLFLDEYSPIDAWEDEVICTRHLNELSRAYYDDGFGHIKKMRDSGGKEYECGFPEIHSAHGNRRMSYQMSKNWLLINGTLIPAGTPLCDRHYKPIPKKPISPRCSPIPEVPQCSQQCSQPQDNPEIPDDFSQGIPDDTSQEDLESTLEKDDDWCLEDDDVAPRSKLESNLREFLKEADVKRAFCKKRLSDLTPKNLKAKTHTVIQILQIIVGQLTNTVEDYNRMMELVTEMLAGKTLAEENAILNSMMHAVAENFNRLVKYSEKVQLLSIFANHIKYHVMVQYIPNLAERMWNEAKKRAISPKIARGEEPYYWFFPTKKITSPEPGDVHDDAVTGEAPVADVTSDSNVQSLFICSKCSASFIRHSNLLRHVDKGDHKILPEKVSMYDFALGLFKRVLEEAQQVVGVGPLSESFKEYEEAPKDPRPMGWALRTTKKGARYNPVANKMVTDLFEEFFKAGKKLRADEAEKRMRERRDISPSERMTLDQIKNRIRTLLAKKKEEQEKHHRNRQRRMVAQLADWIRDSEEEGGVIEDEVDVPEDDQGISAEAIYDMIHGLMMDELFTETSNPIFSDLGEFDQ